jgi:2'-5' RNA ligase
MTLRDALMRTLGQTEARPFRAHVTLARLREAQWTFARRHPIDIDLSLVQCIRTVELFKSPSAGTTGYQVIASTDLASQQCT